MYYKPLEPNEARQNKIKGRKFKAGRCIIGMRKGLTFLYRIPRFWKYELEKAKYQRGKKVTMYYSTMKRSLL